MCGEGWWREEKNEWACEWLDDVELSVMAQSSRVVSVTASHVRSSPVCEGKSRKNFKPCVLLKGQ